MHVVDSDAETVLTNDDGSFEVRGTRSSAPCVRFSTGSEVRAQLPEPEERMELTRWWLSVVEAGPESEPAPHLHDLDGLTDWRHLTGLEHASGFGNYTSTIDLPASWTAQGMAAT